MFRTEEVHLYMANFQFGKANDKERYEREFTRQRNDLLREPMPIRFDHLLDNPIHVKPFYFIQVLDTNTNISRLIEGPITLTVKDNEQIIFGPSPCIELPVDHYCIIENPVLRDKESGQIVTEVSGQAKLLHGKNEIRVNCPPFGLYPGERLVSSLLPLPVLVASTALKLRSLSNFTDTFTSMDGKPITRISGEEWLYEGPRTYFPHSDVEMVCVVYALIVKDNQNLHVRAMQDFVDRSGILRKSGEEWIYSKPGAYFPDAREEVLKILDSIIMSDDKALLLKAKTSFVDRLGIQRKAGDEWLLTREDIQLYTPTINEEYIRIQSKITLTKLQFCIIKDPYNKHSGSYQYGQTKLIRGEASFFVYPGEQLIGIESVILLDAEDAIIVRAREKYDDDKVVRLAGQTWTIYGPCEFISRPEVQVLGKRRALINYEPLNLHLLYFNKVL